MFGVGSPPKEGGAPPGQNKANSEAARKFLEKEKSESVDGTPRKKKIRDREREVVRSRLGDFTQPLKE